MKNITTIIICFIAFSSTVFANVKPIPVLNTEAVTVMALDDVSAELFISAEYDLVNENLVFETKEDINVIQIFKGNNLEYQLPVMSKKVTINKNLFEKGDYKLGFIVAGKIEANYTEVNIK